MKTVAAEPLLRYFSGLTKHHFWTTDPTEMSNTMASRGAYSPEPNAGFMFVNKQIPGTVPLLRYGGQHRADKITLFDDHIYTNDPNEFINPLEYIREPDVGFVFVKQIPGTLPLMRFFNPTGGRFEEDHYITTDIDEIPRLTNAGYVREPDIGFIFIKQPTDTINTVKIWINAFIPRNIDGLTATVPAGPHRGKTMLPGPIPGYRTAFLQTTVTLIQLLMHLHVCIQK
jgi:hypothetical protein